MAVSMQSNKNKELKFVIRDCSSTSTSSTNLPIAYLSRHLMDRHLISYGESKVLRGREGRQTACKIIPDLQDKTMDGKLTYQIRLNSVLQDRLGVAVGDSLIMLNLGKIKNGKIVWIRPLLPVQESSLDLEMENLLESYLMPYFLGASRLVCEGDVFEISRGWKKISFTVAKTNPSPFCIVSPGTTIRCEEIVPSASEPRKRTKRAAIDANNSFSKRGRRSIGQNIQPSSMSTVDQTTTTPGAKAKGKTTSHFVMTKPVTKQKPKQRTSTVTVTDLLPVAGQKKETRRLSSSKIVTNIITSSIQENNKRPEHQPTQKPSPEPKPRKSVLKLAVKQNQRCPKETAAVANNKSQFQAGWSSPLARGSELEPVPVPVLSQEPSLEALQTVEAAKKSDDISPVNKGHGIYATTIKVEHNDDLNKCCGTGCSQVKDSPVKPNDIADVDVGSVSLRGPQLTGMLIPAIGKSDIVETCAKKDASSPAESSHVTNVTITIKLENNDKMNKCNSTGSNQLNDLAVKSMVEPSGENTDQPIMQSTRDEIDQIQLTEFPGCNPTATTTQVDVNSMIEKSADCEQQIINDPAINIPNVHPNNIDSSLNEATFSFTDVQVPKQQLEDKLSILESEKDTKDIHWVHKLLTRNKKTLPKKDLLQLYDWLKYFKKWKEAVKSNNYKIECKNLIDALLTRPLLLRLGDVLIHKKSCFEIIKLSDIMIKKQLALGFNDNDLHTVSTQHRFARSLYSTGKFVQSLSWFKIVVDQRTTLLGPDHRDTFSSRYWLGRCMLKCGNFQEALTILQSALEKQKKLLTPNHEDVEDTEFRIAVCFDRLENYKESEAVYQMVNKKANRRLGPTHIRTIITQYNVARSLDKQNKIEGALQMYKTFVPFGVKYLGRQNYLVLKATNRIKDIFKNCT